MGWRTLPRRRSIWIGRERLPGRKVPRLQTNESEFPGSVYAGRTIAATKRLNGKFRGAIARVADKIARKLTTVYELARKRETPAATAAALRPAQ